MKLSESWLREWVNPNLSTDEIVTKLTMAGLEVDALLKVAGDFSGVVVGEIISTKPHPDADKLRVCQVKGSPEGDLQVVCGAANARAGIKVPFALVDAELPGGVKIKRANLRNVESFGMLCGQDELEVGDDNTGLWELSSDAPVGADLRDYLGLDDHVYELDLTPNRSDCLSVAGVARELAALSSTDLFRPKISSPQVMVDTVVNIHLEAGAACPRYAGRVIEGIDNLSATPSWMVEKLRRSGIRSIDAVVDVTNYVLLELGQPMHAFDKAKVDGDICVRFAKDGEKIQLLNEQTITLNSGSLVIADENAPLALAGVMGGVESAVNKDTNTIFLEAAFFDPIAVAGKARDFGLHTDSSHRFERGVDYTLSTLAIERATELLIDIAGGKPGPLIIQELQHALPQTKNVTLKKQRLVSALNLNLDELDAENVLQRLGLTLLESNEERWLFEIPSYRFDIAIDADLIEEVARVYGYEKLPTRVPYTLLNLPDKSENKLTKSVIARHLVSREFNEVVVYSFIDPQTHALFFENQQAVELRNPISRDMGAMRSSLLPGLVETLKANLNRQKERVRIFEAGLVFDPMTAGQQHYSQSKSLAALIYGKSLSGNWNHGNEDVDFYDIKGELESVLSLGGALTSFSFDVDLGGIPSFMHPGQTAVLRLGDDMVGLVGALHPSILKQMGLIKPAYVFELQLDSLLTGAQIPSYVPVSKFPAVTRDLAMMVDKNITVKAITDVIKNTASETLKELSIFDQYMGDGIEESKKSLAFSLTFQHNSRTLNEEEIARAVENIVTRLDCELGAIQR